jgi:hypothetical protein
MYITKKQRKKFPTELINEAAGTTTANRHTQTAKEGFLKMTPVHTAFIFLS